jgi:ATP-dependent Clp protease ATP-binding subunit ClpC
VELKSLYARIEQIGYRINLSDEAKAFVASKGYDVQFGARPLKRAIQNYIEDGISDIIVNGGLPLGSVIHITLHENKNELVFN